MSSFLLGVPVSDGGAEGVVVFEVDRSEVAEDLVLASPEPGKAAVRARASLEEALAGLRPSLTKIVEVLGEIAPERMTVEFGVKMGGETGVIIAKGTAEVNFKVTLCWNPGPSGDSENVE